MTDPDQTVTFSIRKNENPPPDPWVDDELRADEEQPTADRAVTFTSLGFIGAALKRSAWLLCATALLGVLIGYGFYVKYPPAYQATTSVLLTNNPADNPADQIQTNVALAQSQAVASRVVQQLGLPQSVSSFLAAYTVTSPSNQVIVFTVGASSSNDAVARVSALASAFLQYRADYLKNQQQLEETTLNQQVSQAQQQVDSINQQISQVSAQATSPDQQAKLSSLRLQLTTATNALTTAQQSAAATVATTRTTTATMVRGSQTLNAPTALPHGLKKGKAFYIAVTLILGLVIGMIIVIVRAIVSDRLRHRDDIADAIGAPVKLSIGPVSGRSRLPGLGRRAGRRVLDMRRLVTHLNGAVPRSSRRLKGLAVVAVDNAEAVAPAIVSLATSSASQGKHVVVADLSDGRYAARRLGVKKPGVHSVRAHGADFVVVTPERDDIALVGPIPSSQGEPAKVSPELAAACGDADVLLTLATLDPASGGDFLSTWATDAVAMVTAGKSSTTRIHAVGEMVRLAGLRLGSVVLIGADKGDESLGLVSERDNQSTSVLPL
jgi:capsular polysaccharide biosynthesis protein